MGQLLEQDLGRIVVRMPKAIRKMLMEEEVFLGGGFIRSTIENDKPTDIDLFGGTYDHLNLQALKLATIIEGKMHRTKNAITILAAPRTPIQFITRWLFTDTQKLIESFDFTIAKAVVWYDRETEKWKSLCDDRYYADLASKRLVYTFPVREEEAGGSMMRVRKFLKRGYSINSSSLAGVMSRMVLKIDWDKKPDGANEEVWITTILTSLLHEVDPLMVVDGVEFRDEADIENITGQSVESLE